MSLIARVAWESMSLSECRLSPLHARPRESNKITGYKGQSMVLGTE